MKKILTFCLALILFLTTSCASIVSDSSYDVKINSRPSGATYTITDEYNQPIVTGRTPDVVTLDSGDGFFSKAKYFVKVDLDGYAPARRPLVAKLDGWYFGNIPLLWLGLVGALIVDPATGAMWKLPSGFNVDLVPVDVQ